MMRLFLLIAVCVYTSGALACGDAAPLLGRTMTLGEMNGTYIGYKGDPALGLKDKEIVLTFDDGPAPGSTEKILDILKAQCLKATFMMVGNKAEKNPALAKRVAAEGHTVGYHSWSHKNYLQLNPLEMERETARGIRVVDKALAPDYVASNFFRFPYFDYNIIAREIVRSHDLIAIDSSFMVPDWTNITPQEIHDQMMNKVRADGKGIMLLHDVFDRTAEALPLILASLKKEGYTIVHIVPEE